MVDIEDIEMMHDGVAMLRWSLLKINFDKINIELIRNNGISSNSLNDVETI